MRSILFFSLLLIVGMTSCSPSAILSPTMTLVPTLEPVSTITPISNVSQNTATPIDSIATHSISLNIKLQTPEILEEIPENLLLGGTLLINGYEDNPSYFFDLKSKSTEIIPDSFYGARVSPDGKSLAYFEYSENPDGKWENLVIRNDFLHRKIIPWNENWFLSGVGINGNLFILNKSADSLPSFVLMNPNSDETIEITPDFPDIETIYYAAEWWFPSYSPDGTKVVYPRVSQTSRIVLWDIENQKIITTLSSINNPYGLEPVWSPNGRNFVMALENMYLENFDYPAHELFIGNENGRTERLTYLTNFFNDAIRVSHYSWSPDNIHVAFRVAYGKTGQLAVVNTVTNGLYIYELPGDFVHHEPIWSPDGMFVLIDGYFEGSNDYWTLLVNLEKNNIIKIALNSFPVGWVAFSK